MAIPEMAAINDPRFILHAADLAEADGANVGNWTSPVNARTFTVAATPVMRKTGLNGRAGVEFDSAGDNFNRAEANMYDGVASCTIMAMKVTNKTPAANCIIIDTAPNGGVGRHTVQLLTDGTIAFSRDGGIGNIILPSAAFAQGEVFVLTIVQDGTESKMRVNWSRTVQGSATNFSNVNNSQSPLRLGSRFDATAGHLTGLILGLYAVWGQPKLSLGQQEKATFLAMEAFGLATRSSGFMRFIRPTPSRRR